MAVSQIQVSDWLHQTVSRSVKLICTREAAAFPEYLNSLIALSFPQGVMWAEFLYCHMEQKVLQVGTSSYLSLVITSGQHLLVGSVYTVALPSVIYGQECRFTQ